MIFLEAQSLAELNRGAVRADPQSQCRVNIQAVALGFSEQRGGWDLLVRTLCELERMLVTLLCECVIGHLEPTLSEFPSQRLDYAGLGPCVGFEKPPLLCGWQHRQSLKRRM